MVKEVMSNPSNFQFKSSFHFGTFPSVGSTLSRLRHATRVCFFSVAFLLQCAWIGFGADQPQWGSAWERNMVSDEVHLPSKFNLDSGRHVKWMAELGTESHSTPVVSGGKVFIGTNNGRPKNADHQGDRGVLICFDEETGAFLWQLIVPKRDEDPYFDWPLSGISSPATVDGDRVYIVSNRGEVMCLDAQGLRNGNDGPFQNEARHMTPEGREPGEVATTDADILWIFDLTQQAGIWSHDAAHSSILVHGDHLYLNTGTGVDNTHRRIRTPDAPSLVVLDKRTGAYLGREGEGNASLIFHCTWSAPSMGRIDGDPLLFFAGGDGILYGYELLPQGGERAGISTLERKWRFDLDPLAPKEDVHRYHKNTRVGPSNVFGMPVFKDQRIYVAGGGDLWWGKSEAWVQCIQIKKEGERIEGDLIWKYPLNRHVMSTPAVYKGLVFIADCGRTVHCIDEVNGQVLWTHETGSSFWASPYVADGKVYIGSRAGEFFVFEAAAKKNLIFEHKFDEPISATVTAANGVLYVGTMSRLFAFESDVTGEPGTEP